MAAFSREDVRKKSWRSSRLGVLVDTLVVVLPGNVLVAVLLASVPVSMLANMPVVLLVVPVTLVRCRLDRRLRRVHGRRRSGRGRGGGRRRRSGSRRRSGRGRGRCVGGADYRHGQTERNGETECGEEGLVHDGLSFDACCHWSRSTGVTPRSFRALA